MWEQLSIWEDFKPEQKDEYQEFLKKFEAKKTTDDCYTPPAVYDVVLEYVKETAKVDIEGLKVVRPFYPGGDYKAVDYTESVVIDNPPFSITSEIVRFYLANKVPFFLFTQGLSSPIAFSECTVIQTGGTIIYENGATVPTGFVSNLYGSTRIIVDGWLGEAIKRANTNTKKPPKYEYPENVVTFAWLRKGVVGGVYWSCDASECVRVTDLDAMKAKGKAPFGGAYLLSAQATERLKAERLKAERLKAERLKAERLKAEREAIVWELSEREKAIIQQLNKNADGASGENTNVGTRSSD